MRPLYLAGAGLIALGISAGIVSDRVDAQTETTPEAGLEETITDAKAEWIEALAENLGLEPEVVEDAIQQTMIDMVNTRAEEIIANIESGEFPAMGDFGPGMVIEGIGPGHGRGGVIEIGRGRGEIGFDEGGVLIVSSGERALLEQGEALADFFGITVEELHAELRTGLSLSENGAAHGKSAEEIKSFLLEQAETAIDEMLAPEDEEVPVEATPAVIAEADLV